MYRSERFDPGELTVLAEIYNCIDTMSQPFGVDFEVMSGARHRRRVSEFGRDVLGFEPDYVLQLLLGTENKSADLFPSDAGKYLDLANNKIDELTEGIVDDEAVILAARDRGGLRGLDIATTTKYPFGTGTFETEVLDIYTPWAKLRWNQAGRKCVFFCGVNLPKDLSIFVERHDYAYSERQLRAGHVVFRSTPDNLQAR